MYQFVDQGYGVAPEVSYPSGKPRPYFDRPPESTGNEYLQALILRYGAYLVTTKVPCGHCEGCHLKRSAEWALRIVHESRYYARSSFLTLTYDHGHLPESRSLVVEDFQKFMKRLRMRLSRGVLNEAGLEDEKINRDFIGPRLPVNGIEYVEDIKYFACGEYGENKGRPHYHAVLLGWDWPDRVPVPNNPGAKDKLYDSPLLASIWGQGNVRIGDLSANSAAYVARYTMKKTYGKDADREYKETGRIPPFNLASKGIGRRFFHEFRDDIYPCDSILSQDGNHRLPVPRFYDKLQQALQDAFIGPRLEDHKDELREVKAARRARGEEREADNTPERLAVKEKILKMRIASLKKSRNQLQNEK